MSNFNTPDFSYVQVDEFQPNVDGWNLINNVVSWSQPDANSIMLTNNDNQLIKISFLSPTAIRVRFNPTSNADYSRNVSYAVVNYQLGNVTIQVTELTGHGQYYDGNTLLINTGVLQVYIGLQPYGIAVYKDDQLIHQDCYGKNLIYSDTAVANLKYAPASEQYFGFGEKAGSQLNKKSFTLTFFNYDNFTYNDLTYYGAKVVPQNNEGGPLNPSGPLYNSIPFVLAVGLGSDNCQPVQYSYGIFLDNVSQTYFNMGSSDYSDMSGKYYFGALYGDLDYYILVGSENNGSLNVIADVLNQYTVLTGRAALPPKYAFGYQQGCYGYYDHYKLLGAAQAYRDNKIPIDGLHIDVDFQNNYRTFTISPEKFPNPGDMFDKLHSMGFKCSTNITGIVSGNPMDENGGNVPYPTRDSLLDLNPQDCTLSTYKSDAPVHPFIYNTRYNSDESPDIFLANESYGVNNGVNINPYKYPTPMFPNGNEQLGTYGFYSDMGREDVQEWWGQQYDYLLRQGIDMIWQDMTDPAVVPNDDNDCDDKTLPLDLMMYDKTTGEYQPNAAIHNAFALNLIQATYAGITKLKNDDSYKGLYNYMKRNFIIARGGYAGVHRYAGIWTGDSASSWDFLSINIPEVLNAGLSGQPISGCDIGGFANGTNSINSGNAIGITDPELYTRWMNCGAFLPWYRNHYDGYSKSFQEPYMYGEPVLSNCRKNIETRYRLIQLFYDAMYECTQTGMPIARALFLNETSDGNVFQYLNDQFFVGRNLLIAPVVTQYTYNRDVYLPAGSNWYVFDDQAGLLEPPTEGGRSYNWYVPVGLVPIYIREGAIVPIRQLEQYNQQLPQNPITFYIYPGKDSTYQLYQDDEVSVNFQTTDAYRTTQINAITTGSERKISFTRTFDNYTPKEDHYFVYLLGYSNQPSSITANGITLTPAGSADALSSSATNAFYFDGINQKLMIKVFDNQSMLTIGLV